MNELFLKVVNMSISASWIVLAVLLLRLLLKKAPKWINVILWGVVAVRLICPFSFESVLSLIPSPQTINPEIALNSPVIDSGVTIIDNLINPIISEAKLNPAKANEKYLALVLSDGGTMIINIHFIIRNFDQVLKILAILRIICNSQREL